MGNPVMQFQILSKAPEETAKFYCDLFDWSVNADNPLGCRQINTGSKEGIQGGIWPAPPQAPNFVQLFVAVPDLKASSKRRRRWVRKPLFRRPCFPRETKWRCSSIRRGWRSRCGDGSRIVIA